MNDLFKRDRRIFEALNGIDEKYIAEVTEKYEVFEPNVGYAPTKRAKRRIYSRIAAFAACLVFVAGAISALPQILRMYGLLGPGTDPSEVTSDPILTEPPTPDTDEITDPIITETEDPVISEDITDSQTVPPSPDIRDIYESVFASSRNVIHGSQYSYLSECVGYHGKPMYEWESHEVAYIDFDGDGTVEAVYRPAAEDGQFILRYDSAADEVYAYYMEPRDSCIYFACGDITFGSVQSENRYKITGYNSNGDGITYEKIDYAALGIEPDSTEPTWIEIELVQPQKRTADFGSYASIIEMLEGISNIFAADPLASNKFEWYKSTFKFRSDYDDGVWFTNLGFAAQRLHKEGREYGYSIGDINGDGTEELIYLLDDYTVLAIFSISGGRPVLLHSFWDRYTAYIDEQGRILTFASGGASSWTVSVNQISVDCKSMYSIAEIGADGYSDEKKSVNYYKMNNIGKVYITEEEYRHLETTDPFMKESDIRTENNAGVKFVGFEEKVPAAQKPDLSTYEGVINHYREIVELCFEPGMTEKKAKAYASGFLYDQTSDRQYDTLTSMVDSVFSNISAGKSAFGYAICNINGDGNDDLILMLDDGSLLAIFSISVTDGVPWLVESYNEYLKANLDGDGNVHTYTVGMWEDLKTVSELTTNGRGLAIISQLKCFSDYYYLDDKAITKAEYERLAESDPFNLDEGKYTYLFRALEFVPLVEGEQTELVRGVFTVPANATEINAATFAGFDVSEIRELVIGANVKKIDLSLLNGFENLRFISVDAGNENYASFTTSRKASVLVSKTANELLYICTEDLCVDLMFEPGVTDLLDSSKDVKIYVGGGVLNTKFLRDDEDIYTYWDLKSIEFDGKTKTPKEELSMGGNCGVNAFRINDGFVVSCDDYGWTYTVAFINGKIIEYKPLVKGNVRYEIDKSGDGYQFYPGDNGELLYTRTSHNMVSMQTFDWFRGFVKSPETLWKAEGTVDLSGGKFEFTRLYEYTVEDYLESRGISMRKWFEYLKEEVYRDYPQLFPYETLNDLFIAQGGKKYYPDKITKYSDADMIKIYEEVFAGKRGIVSNYADYLSECGSYSGKYLWESLYHSVFYCDFNDDGILDALYSPSYGADTDYLLHYQDGKVYAIGISPREGYVFYANGEFGFSSLRYRITEFNGLNYETETINYKKWTYFEPCMDGPNYVSVELLRPGQTSKPVSDKEPADFSSYESIIKMFRKALDMVESGEVTKDNITTYERPYRFDTAGAYSHFHQMVLCAYYYLPKGENFGYSIGDTNSDGTNELVFMLEDNTVMMLYTMYEGKPNFVTLFNENASIYIDTDGRIHDFRDMYSVQTAVYELSSDGKGLRLLELTQITDNSGGNTYSHTVSKYVWDERETTYITKEEYDRIMSSAPYKKESELDTSKNKGIKFVALD